MTLHPARHPGRHPARFAAAALVAALLAACAPNAARSPDTGGTASPAPTATPASSAAPSSPAAPPPSSAPVGAQAAAPCQGAGLDIAFGAPTSAKFQEAVTLSLVNRGPAACSLTGYPRLQFQSNGRQLPISVAQDTAVPVTAVTLAPGRAAESLLTWNKYEGQGSTCSPTATDVTVTPPGRTVRWLSDPVSASICGGTVRARAFAAQG